MPTSTVHKAKSSVQRYQLAVESFLRYHFVTKKLNTPVGWLFLLAVALFVALVGVKLGITASVLLLGFIVSCLVLIVCLLHPSTALYLSIISSFFVLYLDRSMSVYLRAFRDVPIGSAVDGLLILGLVAVFIDQSFRKQKSVAFLRNPITYAFIIYLLFLAVEFFNPNMNVALGYVSFVRRIFSLLAGYVIVLYIFRNKAFLRNFIKVWIGLAFLAALYGCSQQWFGYMPMEAKWIARQEVLNGRNPFLHEGVLRHFSFFSDPTVFGMFMAISGVFCLIMLTGPFKISTKAIIAFISIFIFLGLGYSGTRTAYVMVPASLFLFALMTITRRSTLILATVSALAFVFVLFGPIYSNQTINRIRTAFEGNQDASLNLRTMKRAMVQPHMFESPFLGGGVESSGVIGTNYDPNHYLAKYVIDSGYVKTAIETGILGLIIIMGCYFTVMYVGIRQFYRSQSLEFRIYIAGMVAVVYSLIIFTYVQKSINQFPAGLILFSIFAILAKIHLIEEKTRQKR